MSPRYSDTLGEYSPDRKVFSFGLKWAMAIIAFVVLIGIVLGVVGFAAGWFGAAAKVVSPDNVTAQFRAAYDDINALNAVAANICTLKQARDAEVKGSDAYTQRESQVLAQEQNFQRIQNHYNAYIHDVFRAKLVRPRDLPDPAPTENQALGALGCAA